MGQQQKTLFIFGLGYVGLHLAQQLSNKGWQIIATTRCPEKVKGNLGWQILPFTDTAPIDNLASHLARATHLISTIGPVAGQDPVIAAHKQQLQAFSGWTGYLSATSVYPDMPEGWVDEDTPPNPATARGKTRLAAEQAWQEACGAEIFRIAGIYGPGRNVFKSLYEGSARIIDKPGHLFNRIHQSDISQIIIAAIHTPEARRILNLADMHPASQVDVVRFAASLAGITPPEPIPLEQANLSEMGRSFYDSQRKIRSKIIGQTLKYSFRYPDYKAGLHALFKAGDQSDSQPAQ